MTSSQMSIRPITAQEMREHAVAAGINVPIEQTWVWAEFEETFPDRDLVGFFLISRNAEPIAVIGLIASKYHGFKFLWAKRGPVWLVPESPELEHAAVQALVGWVRGARPLTAFLRLHLRFPGPNARPPLQVTTYDTTVTVDLAPTEAELMAGYKKRMRSSVRGAIKKTPVQCSDETAKGSENFGEYFEIMAETGNRQGFTPWPKDVYENLLRTLTPEHSRLYAARVHGELVGFAIFTLSGSEAVYYYAAAGAAGRQSAAPAQLLHYALQELGKEGYLTADLMGVGSELAPSLNTLTAFKSGFSRDLTEVAPIYDVPVNVALYRTLTSLKGVKSKADTLKNQLLRREKDD